jgi:hypothetical protein
MDTQSGRPVDAPGAAGVAPRVMTGVDAEFALRPTVKAKEPLSGSPSSAETVCQTTIYTPLA